MDNLGINSISTSSIKNYSTATEHERMEETAKKFESFFVYSMLEQTQPKIDIDNEFFGGRTEQVFRPILNQHIANEITEAGGIGLKDSIMKQMEKYQEASSYGK